MSKLFLLGALLFALSTTVADAKAGQLLARCRAIKGLDGGPLGVGFFRNRDGAITAIFNKGPGFRVATEGNIEEGPASLFGGQNGWTNQRGFEMAIDPRRPRLRKVRFTLDGYRRDAISACAPSSF